MSATVLPAQRPPPPPGGGAPALTGSAGSAALQSAAPSSVTSSLIFPPADLRGIIEKTAQFVAKNGIEFEQRVRREQNNQRFAFLFPNNPYHAYYQLKVREYTTGEEAPRPQVPQAILDMRKKEEEKAKRKEKLLMLTQYGDREAEKQEKKVEPPPPEVYSVVQPYIAAIDVEVIQTTAQFVARNGQRFLSGLAQRERQNPQFEFLKPTHALFQYFTNLVDAYTKCLLPPAEQTEKVKEAAANPQNALKRCMQRFLWEMQQEKQRKEKDAKQAEERALMQAIDWHDFFVVETIDFTEEDDMLPLAAPIDFSANRSIKRPPPTALAGIENDEEEGREGEEDHISSTDKRTHPQQTSIAALIREAADAAGGAEDEDELDIEDETALPAKPTQQLQQPPRSLPSLPVVPPPLPTTSTTSTTTTTTTTTTAPAASTTAPAASAAPAVAVATEEEKEKEGSEMLPPTIATTVVPTAEKQQVPESPLTTAVAAKTKGKTDEEQHVEHEEEDDLLPHPEAVAAAAMTRPAVRIVKGYVRQSRKRGVTAATGAAGGEQQGEKGLQKCPITGQLVPADQMSQHLRILLLDPKWKEQKEKFLEKAKADSAFAPMGDVEGNLALFVSKRPDLFGSVDEQVIVEDTTVTGNVPGGTTTAEGTKPPPPGPLLPTPVPQPALLPAPPLKRFRTAAEAAAAGATAAGGAAAVGAAMRTTTTAGVLGMPPPSPPPPAGGGGGVCTPGMTAVTGEVVTSSGTDHPFSLTVICEEGGGLEAQEMLIEISGKITIAALKESLLEAGMGRDGLKPAHLLLKDQATGISLMDWRTVESYGLHATQGPRVVLSAMR